MLVDGVVPIVAGSKRVLREGRPVEWASRLFRRLRRASDRRSPRGPANTAIGAVNETTAGCLTFGALN